MAENQPLPPDPIRTKSLSGPIFIATALLMVATFGALYDEFVHKRPYERTQAEWIEKFSAHLDKVTPVSQELEKSIKSSDAYKALDAAVAQADAAARAQITKLDQRSGVIEDTLASMDYGFRDRKGRIDEFINRIENAHDEAEKAALRKELEDFRALPISIKLELRTGAEMKDYTTTTLIDVYLGLKAEQGRISGEKGTTLGPVSAARRARDSYFEKAMGTQLSTTKLEGLRAELANFSIGVKQIYVKEMGELVDRCESCHLGIRKPLEISADDLENKAFTSHPRPELLQIHDPEKFGCSPCHNGSGVALVSADKAHGNFKHWLWPLYKRENFDAGCVQCHTDDLLLAGADTYNKGRELYRWRGCWGCHRYDGYDAESEEFSLVRKDLLDIRVRKEKVDEKLATLPGRRAALSEINDELKVKVEGTKINQEEKDLTQQRSGLETARMVKEQRSKDLLSEIKTVGPSLKEAKMKLKPEWLPVWIKSPTTFRPDTKMPQYENMDAEQVTAISAFLWDAAVTGPATIYKAGDADRGKKLIVERGCYACHSMGEGPKREGGDWAANLSRVGEKANYDYLVRWLLNPKQKTLPYSIDAKRDLTPADFAKSGKEFKFDDDTPCPLTGGQLLTHQKTTMPNLRLTVDDAQDMASFLITKKNADASYAAVTWTQNAPRELVRRGEELVKHYGCAGCHEIAGLENEGRLGTELTFEGSKPIERLDFGHLTHDAKIDKWYNHKGYFERKLSDPQVYDVGKEITNPLQRSKMPNFHLSKPDRDAIKDTSDVTALTTFLLGSVESLVPPAYRDLSAGDRGAIKDGWWIVKKYNCNGCHQFLPESDPNKLPALWKQKWFSPEGENMETWTSATGEIHKPGAVMRPPTLVGQGARVDPQWLAEFLRNPALSKSNTHRNGVRGYLNVRMPTYNLSEGEISKLVRFFEALSKQPTPYVRPEQTPLTAQETEAAWAVFVANDCAKCHAQGEVITPQVNAPSFTLTPNRLRPSWVHRWIVDPTSLIPETAMPKGLFVREAGTGRWVTAKNPSEWPAILKTYKGDHSELIVRLMSQYNVVPQPAPKR